MATFTVKIAAAAVLSLSEANRLTSCESAATLVLSNFRGERLDVLCVFVESGVYNYTYLSLISMMVWTSSARFYLIFYFSLLFLSLDTCSCNRVSGIFD